MSEVYDTVKPSVKEALPRMAQVRKLNSFGMTRNKTNDNRVGRSTEELYEDILRAFVEETPKGEEFVPDLKALGKLPLTMRQGLNNAAKRLKFPDGKSFSSKVLISLVKEKRDGEDTPVPTVIVRWRPSKDTK